MTKAEVDALLADERKKFQTTQQRMLDEVEALRTKSTLTAQERKELEGRLENLKSEFLTKEQLADREKEKLTKQMKDTSETLTKERDSWRQRFEVSTVLRSITDAAATNKAFNASQVVAILRPSTKVVETVDAEGKPTGEYEAMVDFADKDKAGKPVTVRLTPADAVKRMRELPDFGNLFEGTGVGGRGGQSRGTGGKLDLKTLATDPVAYREARKRGEI
jgi:hypothetical protein